MRQPFKIGKQEYKFKKDAISHYRAILNSYNFGEVLNDSDHDDIINLLNYDYFNYLISTEHSEVDLEENTITDEGLEDNLVINQVKIAKVQFNTKCFELFFSDNTSAYISYLMIINKKRYTPENLFYIACRNAVHGDIHSVKQKYFDDNSVKGQVKCQETGELSKWTELVLDHRQPNTFSIIIDRFKEVTNPDLDTIEYESDEQNCLVFKDKSLIYAFKEYHKEKANLRIVRKECNSSRTGMARVKKTTKDLTIK
jgi:hypothetical protein